jgi:hypothetical protein
MTDTAPIGAAGPARLRFPRLPNFRELLAQKLVRWGLSLHDQGNSQKHARRELELAGWFKKDGFYGDMMGSAVMDMMALFSMEGHSGMSASVATSLFEKLSRFEPLCPLTGGDDEWTDISDFYGQPMWQNKRCGRIFKEADGSAYDIEGKVFREPSGACFTSRDSRVPVTFPYTPTTIYVDVPASGQDDEDR